MIALAIHGLFGYQGEAVVNVGDRVHVGDVVARLDPQDLKLQVESAEAEFAALERGQEFVQQVVGQSVAGFRAVESEDRDVLVDGGMVTLAAGR